MSELTTSLAKGLTDYLLVAGVVAIGAVLLALVIIKAAAIRAPIHRHAVWLWTVVAAIILPGVWLGGPTWEIAVLPMSAEPAARPLQSAPSPLGVVETAVPVPDAALSPQPAHPAAPLTRGPAAGISWATILAVFWLSGVAVMLMRLVLSWCRLRRIVISASPATEAEDLPLTGGANVAVLSSPEVAGPVCFGLFSPVIILPRRTLTSCPAGDLEMILVHELAHIERRDNLVNLFQRIVETVLFFHPLVWYASHQLTQQREQICDNYVLAGRGRAADYAELLAGIFEQGREEHRFQAIALFEGKLLVRVRSILDPARDVRTKSSRPVLVVCAALLLICAACGAIRLGCREAKDGVPLKTLTVDVTDSNGSSVAGADVEAPADCKPAAYGSTDHEGRAVLKLLADAGVTWVVALKAGAGFNYYENYADIPQRPLDELPDEIHLVLGGARTIGIKAVDKVGEPVPGVSFVPWTIIMQDRQFHVNLSGSRVARAVTDKKGLAVFDWFPAKTSENIVSGGPSGPRPRTSFMVQDGDYYWPQYLDKPYSQYEPEVTARVFRNGTISGRVFLPDGHGAAGILVRAEGRGNTPYFCRRTTRTAPDGSYRLSVYSNQIYMVTVEDEKWAAQTRSGLLVREHEFLENVDLNLVKGTQITGRVDIEAADQPAVGHLVFLSQDGPDLPAEFNNEAHFGSYSKKQTLIRTTRTDRQGRYMFRVGPGQYAFGTRMMIDHSGQELAINLTVAESDQIVRDLATELLPGIGDSTVGLVFAHQDEVYDGTMVVNSCDYCHWPLNGPQ